MPRWWEGILGPRLLRACAPNTDRATCGAHPGLRPWTEGKLAPKRQAGPNALVCSAAHSKMQLSYSAWNRTEGLKLQVGGWLDSNEHQSKTVHTVPMSKVEKGQKGRGRNQWVTPPHSGHRICPPTLSSSPLEALAQQEAG